MNKKYILIGVIVICLLWLVASLFSSDNINAIEDPDFTEDGILKNKVDYYEAKAPSSIKFYIESSGSMNGFFRANLNTNFKRDVWSVISSDLHLLSNGVHVLSNDGDSDILLTLDHFRTKMNSGTLASQAETKVPTMLNYILRNININTGEVAILISDMKYSPAGSDAMPVLLAQYTEEIRNISLRHKAAYSLIAATSNYIDSNGNNVSLGSPYYFFIIGHPDVVPTVRNIVATLVDDNHHYVEEFSYNLNYKTPKYEIKSVRNGMPLEQSTIKGVTDGKCSFVLSIDITNYRWVMANDAVIREKFKLNSLHGATTKIKSITINNELHSDRMLKRQATADIAIEVDNIGESGDVLEWILEPDEETYHKAFEKFLGATSENEYDKSFSIESFIEGCIRGSKSVWNEKKSKILISTQQ